MDDDMPAGSIQLQRTGYVSWYRVVRNEDWGTVLKHVLALPEVAGCTVRLFSWGDGGWREGLCFTIPY